MEKKGDLGDFKSVMVVGVGLACLSILETAGILEFSNTAICRIYSEWPEKEEILRGY